MSFARLIHDSPIHARLASSGQTYFHNEKTGQSSWSDPRKPTVAKAATILCKGSAKLGLFDHDIFLFLTGGVRWSRSSLVLPQGSQFWVRARMGRGYKPQGFPSEVLCNRDGARAGRERRRGIIVNIFIFIDRH